MAFGRKKHDSGDKPLESYNVTYRGGLAELPKAKVGQITFQLWPDRFELLATVGSKKFWTDLTIPYGSVREVAVVDRQVSTFEALAGGMDSRQLNQKNNIHITFDGQGRSGTLLRLEMLSGVTVQGQAKKCLEFQDRMRAHAVAEQFGARPMVGAADGAGLVPGGVGVAEQIKALADLHSQGILTDAEFADKKADLLSRM